MISHEFGFIFIHIPKCAGTSVETFFGHMSGRSTRGAQDHRPIRMLQQPLPLLDALRDPENRWCLARRLHHRVRRHANPRNTRTVTAAQYRDYKKFTIIRDPWSRTYSWYRNVVRDPLHRRKYGVSPTTSFATFLDRFGGRGMLAPIDYWIKEFDGRVALDHIIYFENLHTEFREFCREIGADGGELPRRNTSEETAKLEEIYDENLHDKVARLYHDEIATYGFTFPASPRPAARSA